VAPDSATKNVISAREKAALAKHGDNVHVLALYGETMSPLTKSASAMVSQAT
jgi:hypothetical protein